MVFDLNQALMQVRELRARVVENRWFLGYSPGARFSGAVIACIGTFILGSSLYPRTTAAHVVGWGFICGFAVLFNYGALTRWFLEQPAEERQWGRLRPVLDALPALLCGGVLTFALLAADAHDLLFGVWMLLFGLMHTSSRHVLPREIWFLGLAYIAAGVWYLMLFQGKDFTNPYPMGAVFFAGECAGSVILLKHRERTMERAELRASRKADRTVGAGDEESGFVPDGAEGSEVKE